MSKPIPVESYRMPSGRWGVRTQFMKMPVGDYLGKSEEISESEAVDLARRWAEMQDRSEKLQSVRAVKPKKKGYLKEVPLQG